jgi:myo-inositol-1(or 4)-monophosphatase
MLDIAIQAARAAGHYVREQYHQPQKVSVKGFRDIVTEADLHAEAITLEIIRAGCPDARFVTEETHHQVADYGDAPTWYIDPIDGTTNFARGLPMFSVSVAMARGGQVQCGAVYDPLLDQMFYAERGAGAFLNGRRLRVSERATLSDSVVTLNFPRDQAARIQTGAFLARVLPQIDGCRSRGSAALGFCAVATGWTEVYFQYTLLPWDVAAGILLVEEAGGRVSDLRGRGYALDTPDWLVTNGLVHQAMLDLQPFA